MLKKKDDLMINEDATIYFSEVCRHTVSEDEVDDFEDAWKIKDETLAYEVDILKYTCIPHWTLTNSYMLICWHVET